MRLHKMRLHKRTEKSASRHRSLITSLSTSQRSSAGVSELPVPGHEPAFTSAKNLRSIYAYTGRLRAGPMLGVEYEKTISVLLVCIVRTPSVSGTWLCQEAR